MIAERLVPARKGTVPTSPEDHEQRTHGTLAVSKYSAVSSYPNQPTMTDEEKARARSTQAVRDAGKGKGKGAAKRQEGTGNKAYTRRVKRHMKTSMQFMDTKVLEDRVEEGGGEVHIGYGVFNFPRGQYISPEFAHEVQAKFVRGGRSLLGGTFSYVWNIEFHEPDKSGHRQPHFNFLMAVTEREAYLLCGLWARLAGHDYTASRFRLKRAARVRLSTSHEERTLGVRGCISKVMHYVTACIGDSELAKLKREQYICDDRWMAAGTGAMWGKSRDITYAETIQLELTNLRQRQAVERYLRERLNIRPRMVRWVYDTGEVSEPVDVSPFGPGRSTGTIHAGRITPDMITDLRLIIRRLADPPRIHPGSHSPPAP